MTPRSPIPDSLPPVAPSEEKSPGTSASPPGPSSAGNQVPVRRWPPDVDPRTGQLRRIPDEDGDFDTFDSPPLGTPLPIIEGAPHDLRLRSTGPDGLRDQEIVLLIRDREMCFPAHWGGWVTRHIGAG